MKALNSSSKNFAIAHYFAEKGQQSYFFNQPLQTAIDNLRAICHENALIRVYPDATVKRNTIPNGVAIISDFNHALLIPFLLRDPGCGFLTFKLKRNGMCDQTARTKMGNAISQLVNQQLNDLDFKRHLIGQHKIEDIIFCGLQSIVPNSQLHEKFLHLNFPLDIAQVKLQTEELSSLYNDLLTLTNTVEIRQVSHLQCKFSNRSVTESYDVQEGDLIGFIHSGCDLFPEILAKNFVFNIAKYSDEHQLVTLEQIKQNFFGIPITSDLGYQYWQWLKAAMNYALVSRYLIFVAIQELLETEFGTQLSIINDVTHAGVFCEVNQETNQERIISTRGVQPIYKPDADRQPPSLSRDARIIAGQKESIALLVTGGRHSGKYNHLVQHGTSYQLAEKAYFQPYFTKSECQYYHHVADQAYYNTEFNDERVLPYNFNSLTAANYQQKVGLVETLAILDPFINVHSNKAIKGHHLKPVP